MGFGVLHYWRSACVVFGIGGAMSEEQVLGHYYLHQGSGMRLQPIHTRIFLHKSQTNRYINGSSISSDLHLTCSSRPCILSYPILGRVHTPPETVPVASRCLESRFRVLTPPAGARIGLNAGFALPFHVLSPYHRLPNLHLTGTLNAKSNSYLSPDPSERARGTPGSVWACSCSMTIFTFSL